MKTFLAIIAGAVVVYFLLRGYLSIERFSNEPPKTEAMAAPASEIKPNTTPEAVPSANYKTLLSPSYHALVESTENSTTILEMSNEVAGLRTLLSDTAETAERGAALRLCGIMEAAAALERTISEQAKRRKPPVIPVEALRDAIKLAEGAPKLPVAVSGRTMNNFALDPYLTPLQQQDAARQGMSAMAYVLNKRLGSLRSVGNFNPLTNEDTSIAGSPWVSNNQTSAGDPAELLNDPRFQAVLLGMPDKASKVFEALTGKDLKACQEVAAEQQKRVFDFNTYQLRAMLESNEADFVKAGKLPGNITGPVMPDGSPAPDMPDGTTPIEGTLVFRNRVPSNADAAPSHYALGGTWNYGDNWQQSLQAFLPDVVFDLAKSFEKVNETQWHAKFALLQAAGRAEWSRIPDTAVFSSRKMDAYNVDQATRRH